MKKAFSLIISLLILTAAAIGLSVAVEADNYTLTWPVPDSNVIVQNFSSYHAAIDIALNNGTAVTAAKPGVVLNVYYGCSNNNGAALNGCNLNGCAPSYNFWYSSAYGRYFCNNGIGNGVIIKHYDGTYTQYAHMSKPVVAVGQAVETGQLLGFGGSTGCSTGPHLHFEFRQGTNDSIFLYNIILNSNPLSVSSAGVNYLAASEAKSSSTLKLSYVSYPQNLKAASTFAARGLVSSKNKIKTVTAGVYTNQACTTAVFSHTSTPNAYIYDLYNLDYYMTFSSLTNGKTYYYKVSASDGSQTASIVQAFKVSSSATVTMYANSNGTTVSPTSIKLNTTASTVTLGYGKQLHCTVSPANFTTSDKITWSTSNSAVAAVDANGYVSSKGVGTATITAKTANGYSASCKITVNKQTSTVTVSAASRTIGVGETTVISAKSSVSSDSISWKSSNTDIAAVSSNGNIIGIKSGTVSIIASSSSGGTATVKITVKPAPTSVTLNKTSITLGVGETYDLNSTVNSGSASYVRTYTTNNSAVADAPGSIVNAKKAGTATITVSTYNGKTATCIVTVKLAPTSVKLNKTSITLGVGETYDLNSTVSSGSSSYIRSYTTNNSSVADAPDSIIRTKKVGTATITVSTYNGKTATCTVTVKPAPTSVALNKTSITLGVGETYDLNSTVNSGSASYVRTYTTNNSAVADAPDSIIRTKKVGTATITVSTYNGKTATCIVTVKPAPTSVKLNKTSITLGVGETYDLNSTVSSGSSSYIRSYTTNNSAVADAPDSIIRTKKVGTATITVSTYNGKKTTCTVTVKPAPTSVKLNKTSLTLNVGETYDLDSTVNSGSASYVRIYTTNNSAVADAPGSIVNAKKAGTATITVSTYNGKKTTCIVTVKSSTVTTLSAPASISISHPRSREIVLSWSAVPGADGYELYRSKTSSTSGFISIKDQQATTFSNTEMVIGTTYYYKVRAYKKVGNQTVYSDYKSASIKVTK